jgi:NitT/TauT family transport system permease protein
LNRLCSFLRNHKPSFTRDYLFTLFGFLLLLAGWQVLSFYTHEILLASPARAISGLWDMIGTSYFNGHFLITLKRVFFGLLFGGVSGFLLGTAAGLNRDIRNILKPFRWIMLSISPVVVVVLAMLWFGLGSTMVVFIASVLIMPIVYVNTVKGIEMVDATLVEMAQLYRFSLFMRIKDLYTPAIVGPLSAAMVLVICMGVRVVILAELMGANDGIGYALGTTRSNLDMPQLFAWILVSLGIVSILEFCLLRPIEKHFRRWQL